MWKQDLVGEKQNLSDMPKEFKELNIGYCPYCRSSTHFKIFEKTVLICSNCDSKVIQRINGVVKYEKINVKSITGE